MVSELIGLILYFAALLCSHVVAFHTEKNLKMAALKHLSKMPLGYFDANPSGQLRKIIDENSFQTETFIAHQLPDLVGAQVTMIAGIILILAFDWRIGVPLLLLYGIDFFLQGALNGKEGMEFMKQYQTSLPIYLHTCVDNSKPPETKAVPGGFIRLYSFRTCIHRRGMPDGRGILPPCKAKNRRNTGCISRFFNAAGRQKTRPHGVQRL